MKLVEAAEPLAWDTAFWLLGFEEPGGTPIEQLGGASVELCAKLRALAIIALLTTGDSEKFLHNLARSGRVREAYLSRIRQAERVDDYHFASGRISGLIDAIASGDLALAHRIAWISPREWSPQREYEDDFCYAQVLHRIVHGVSAVSVYEPIFERFESAMQGQPAPRLDVVRALVARSQSGFEAAFESLVQTREDEIAAAIARSQLQDAQVVAERQVFVEGLALLRLADAAGIATREEYLYCPSNARVTMRAPVPDPPA